MTVMRILACLLAAVSLNCLAAPFTVRLGIEKLVLDAPPGFTDTTELASPRLQDLAMIAVTPKGLERERLTPAQLASYVTDSVQNLGKPVNPPDLVKYLEKQPIGKASLLAELKREAATVSVLQATRLPPLPGKKFWESSTPQYLVFTTTIFVVRGKALQLAVFSLYESPADLDWLKTTTERWVDDLQRLNR